MARTDALRREAYLARFAWHMQDYPQRDYRRIRDDLRREIDAAAADVGMRAALRDMGHPHALARGYHAELGRPVPRWATGAVAGAGVVVVIVVLAAAYGLGVLDGLAGAGGGTVTLHPFGTTTTYTATDAEVSAAAEITWGTLAVVGGVAAVVLLLAARAWRLVRR
ncbi:MAG: hypothetical protein GX609_08195 [Actinomycetales bacterium]|nr:hypothetical protein [Actinomycetales bacterium]